MSVRLVAAFTAPLLLLAGCAGDDSAADTPASGAAPASAAPHAAPGPGARLVLASPAGASGLAPIGGMLAIAEDGCVTIGDTPAVLPAGTTLAEGDDALVTDDGRTVAFGDRIAGSGGYPVAEASDEIVSVGCAVPGEEVAALGIWDVEAEWGSPAATTPAS